jgi:CMP-N-acetylneuraminic acid synthetase
MVNKLKKNDFLNEFWAFIPARSGSKGIKNKNIRKIAGVPLLAYSIKTALNCKKIKKVIFSSDSQKYIDIAKKYGCKHFHKRGKKVSSDTASELSVFQDYIKKRIQENKKLPKYFVHLRPTCPLRKIETINKLINHFRKFKKKTSCMRTVSFMSNPAYRYNRIINGKLCALTKKDFNLDKWFRPRQFFPKTYLCNTIADIYKTKNILNGFLFGNNVRPFLTNDYLNDIDSVEDFKKLNNNLL